MDMNRLKRSIGVGVTGALALSVLGLIGGSPARATVKTGEINCTATTILGPVALRNPSSSHVVGPYWAAKSAAVTITIKAGTTLLPRTSGPGTIGSYQDLVNKFQVVGTATTTMTAGAIPGLVYTYDPDTGDNGGVPNPVAMDGVATYAHAMDGVLGPFPAPTVVVSAPLPLVGTPGTYDVTITLDPGAGTLPTGSTPGNPGAMIFAPDIALAVTNTGTADGTIELIATSTTLTANVTAPIVTAATTNCGQSTLPQHTVHIQTDGAPRVPGEPVVACDPTPGTPGLLKDSKGWWSKDTNAATAENYAGNAAATSTYDGCTAPDQQLADWVLSKNGVPAASALQIAKAQISIKAKHFGNCTNVDIIDSLGRRHNADDPTSYEMGGTLGAKWLTAANAAIPGVKPTGATVAARLVINRNVTTAQPLTYVEATGVVTKGLGAGGAVTFVGELDTASTQVAGIIACNTPGYSPPATGVFRGGAAPQLPIVTGDDAVLEIAAP
jgi:hypothetical protein